MPNNSLRVIDINRDVTLSETTPQKSNMALKRKLEDDRDDESNHIAMREQQSRQTLTKSDHR